MTVPSSLPVVTFSLNGPDGQAVEWSCGGSLTESNEYDATPPNGDPDEPHVAAKWECEVRTPGESGINFVLGLNWNDSISNAVRTAMLKRILTAHAMTIAIEEMFGGGGGEHMV